MKKRTQQPRGSVLVFSLLVLFMLLSVAISAATVVIAARGSNRVTEKSAVAFQVAEGAVENVLKRVYKNNDANLTVLSNRLLGSSSCDSGTISGTLPWSSGTYSVTFFDNNSTTLTCVSVSWRTNLVRVRAVGSFAGVTRSIDVGVEP